MTPPLDTGATLLAPAPAGAPVLPGALVRRRALAPALVLIACTGVAALAPGSGAAPAAKDDFTWRQRAVAPDSSFTEPSLAIDADGDIVVCAPGGPGTVVWYSKDDGKTFGRSETGVAEGTGGGDCEIHFLPDGTLVNSDLAITTSYVHISADGGKTWERGEDSGQEQDRQWFASYRDEELYNVYHGIVEEYEFFTRSTDAGQTWSAPILINSPDQLAGTPSPLDPQPGDTPNLIDQGYNTFSGPMLVDQKTGEMYVLYSLSDAATNVQSIHGFGATRGIVAAYSDDKGATWKNRYAVTGSVLGGTGTTNGAIFPWGTLGPDGTLYVLFNSNRGGRFHTYYTYSKDHGESWSEPVKVSKGAASPTAGGATVYVTGQAGAPGVLDIAWLETTKGIGPDDEAGEWDVVFAQVRGADTAKPTIDVSTVSDHTIHKGAICQMGLLCVTGGDRSLGDFFELAIGPDGMAQIAWSDNGRDEEPKQVWWAKQSSGPSAFAAAARPAPGKPKPTAPKPPVAQPRPDPAPRPLPATGAPAVLPVIGAALLVGSALVVRRRRAS